MVAAAPAGAARRRATGAPPAAPAGAARWRRPLALALALAAPRASRACTRVLYTGDDKTVLTRRTLDWVEDTFPSLWAMPRGVARGREAGPGSAQWTSKYGSLIVSFQDVATLDGINEKGLVGNALYLAESNYGKLDGKPRLSITPWVQYGLDNYATVNGSALRAEPFRLVAPVREVWPGERVGRGAEPPRARGRAACAAAIEHAGRPRALAPCYLACTRPAFAAATTARCPPLAALRCARSCPAARARRRTCRCQTQAVTRPSSSTWTASSPSTTTARTAS
jgi:hypothetical protein